MTTPKTLIEALYVEYDEDYDDWGVFGEDSGFKYAGCDSEAQANEYVKRQK